MCSRKKEETDLPGQAMHGAQGHAAPQEGSEQSFLPQQRANTRVLSWKILVEQVTLGHSPGPNHRCAVAGGAVTYLHNTGTSTGTNGCSAVEGAPHFWTARALEVEGQGSDFLACFVTAVLPEDGSIIHDHNHSLIPEHSNFFTLGMRITKNLSHSHFTR